MYGKLQFDLINDGHRYVALLDGKEVGFADKEASRADRVRA